MDTLTKSCSPTIVITANGEVQTHEEAIVYVKELDMFLTMKVLENTPAVLSFGKLCDENGNSYEWINGQKPHLIKNGIRIICNTENFVPIVVPGLSSSSSGSSSTSRTKVSKAEIEFYRSNWWLQSNVVRVDTMPVRHEPGFKEALSTMQRLKRAEDKKKQEVTAQTSSSSSTWHWHSGGSLFTSTHLKNGMTADSTGEPVLWWFDIYLRKESQRAEEFKIFIVKIGYS